MITIVWRKLDNTELLEFGDFAANYDLNISREELVKLKTDNACSANDYEPRMFQVCLDIGSKADIYDSGVVGSHTFHVYRPLAIITPYQEPVIEPLKERKIEMDL